MTAAGRFAPSPSGELHVGNLRTALLAWLFAKSTGRDFLLRVEDLDRARSGAEAEQLRDLRAVGVSWDAAVVRQTERAALYDEAIVRLAADGRTYECFCTRREIQEAPPPRRMLRRALIRERADGFPMPNVRSGAPRVPPPSAYGRRFRSGLLRTSCSVNMRASWTTLCFAATTA